MGLSYYHHSPIYKNVTGSIAYRHLWSDEMLTSSSSTPTCHVDCRRPVLWSSAARSCWLAPLQETGGRRGCLAVSVESCCSGRLESTPDTDRRRSWPQKRRKNSSVSHLTVTVRVVRWNWLGGTMTCQPSTSTRTYTCMDDTNLNANIGQSQRWGLRYSLVSQTQRQRQVYAWVTTESYQEAPA